MDEDMVVTTYAIALDEKEIFWENGYVDLGSIFADENISGTEKVKLLEALDAKKHINQKDDCTT